MKKTTTFTVELVNFELGYSCQPRRVQGYSAKSYGQSRFDRKYNAHSVTLSLEEYQAAARDLSRAWHQAGRRWVPFFVVNEADETAEQPKKPVAQVAPPATQSVTVTHQPEPKRDQVEIPDELPTKYFGLVALAKKLGINPDQFSGDKPGLIAAIESKRLQPA